MQIFQDCVWSCWFRNGKVWIWIYGHSHRALLVSALGLDWWELLEEGKWNWNAQIHSWRNDQDGRKKGVELLGAPGERRGSKDWKQKLWDKAWKGAGEGGKESLLQESSRGQERIIFHPPAPGESLVRKVRGSYLFAVRFGKKGAISEGNIHLLKFCWIKKKREEAAGEWLFGGFRGRCGKELLGKVRLTLATRKSPNCPSFQALTFQRGDQWLAHPFLYCLDAQCFVGER